MGEASEDMEMIKAKLKKLEKEADARMAIEEETAAHDEVTMKAFIQRVVATAVAWVTAELVFALIHAIAAKATHAPITKVGVFIARLVYSVLALIIGSTVLWLLRPASGRTKGMTFGRDLLNLIKGCIPMIMMWSLTGVVKAIVACFDTEWADALIIAVILTLVTGGMELVPFYARAKANVSAGGDTDTLLARYLMMPSYLTLANGWAWNKFFNYPINLLKSEVSHNANIVFLVQLVACLIICGSITAATAGWSVRSAFLKELEKHDEDPNKLIDVEFQEAMVEKVMGQHLLISLAFVYCWALSFTLNDFFFGLMAGCPKTGSGCSYQLNFIFATICTIIFTYLAKQINGQDRRRPWGKAQQSLQIQAYALCVGWSWMNYFGATITALKSDNDIDEIVWYIILFLATWAVAAVCWRSYLVERRRLIYFRRKALEAGGGPGVSTV